MVRITVMTYLNWVRDLQNYAAEINERAVQDTTEFIFPEVEIMLFSKLVFLWVNFSYLQSENGLAFKERIDRWHLFGHISRVSAEFTKVDESDKDFEARYALNFQSGEKATIELVKKLNWFPKDEDVLQLLSSALKNAVNGFNWSEGKKNSWIHAADMMLLLSEPKTNTK
jgi:hypothetical protein